MNQLTVNSRLFVRHRTPLVDNAIGYFHCRKGGVLLLDRVGEPFAFIVDNVHDEQFIVTAHRADGRTRFMFSTTASTEKALGMEGMSLSETYAVAKAAIASLATSVIKGD